MKTGFGIAALVCFVVFAIAIAVGPFGPVAGSFLAAGCVTAAIAALSWFAGFRPDDDAQDTLMSVPTRRILAMYLLAVGAVLLAAMAWLLWFDFTPLYIPASVK